ncbi:MAG: DUF4302 domain-containing protein [Bacteroides cellulosilyticus]|nr:DUF4302 domain-containing protein [Bacteroides cellulosilyticus]
MKKLSSIFSALCLVVCLVGCKETTITMDGSADARVDAVIKSYIAELAGAEHGWIADVMTDEGYYRFYMTFTADNKVTMYTDNLYYEELNGVPKTSTYNIRSLQRPTLSFDTYSYLSIINDPNNDVSGGSGNMGLGTDFEFEIGGYADGVFTLTGRVNRVDASLRKATAEEKISIEAGGLMSVLVDVLTYQQGLNCYFPLGDATVNVLFNGRSNTFFYIDDQGDVAEVTGFVKVEQNKNIALVEPVVIAGKSITGFAWNEDAQQYSAVIDETQVAVEAQAEPIFPLHYMLGPGKLYTITQTILQMFPSTAQTDNQFGYLMMSAYQYLARTYGMALNVVQLEFTTSESGQPRMIMMWQVGRFLGYFTYYLTFNEAEDEFTVTQMTFEDDSIGNGQVFYGGAAATFADFWVGKTFKIEWTPVTFGSYVMGQIKLVDDGGVPAEFYGACFSD